MDSSSLWSYGTFALVPIASWMAALLISRTRAGAVRTWAASVTLFAAITSTALMILNALGGSSIDIAHLWPFQFRALIAAVPAIAIWRCKFLEPPSYAALLRCVWAVIAVPAVGLFLLVCLSTPGCTRRPPSIYSPDGKHLAIVEFLEAGVFDDDYVTVSLRRSWWPFATVVYSGSGGYDANPAQSSPEVRWIDDSHLLVRYAPSDRGPKRPCVDLKGDVQVVCKSVTR